MNENPPKPSRRSLGYKILIGLACLGLLIFFAVLVLDLVAKHSLNRYERKWEAKGEHFDFASFVPPPVPDDQNFALTPIVASSYGRVLDKNGHKLEPQQTNIIDRLKMPIRDAESQWETSTNTGNWAKGIKTNLKGWQLYYRTLAAKTNEFPVPPQPQTPAADVLLALSKYDAAIAELRQAAALPDSRFPLNYDSKFPAEILLPHLADSIRTEPLMISQLVRIAMLNFALQPVWEGLQDHQWSDAQLAELNQELAKLDFLADCEFSMRSERANSLADIEYLRRSRDVNLLFASEEPTPEYAKVAFHLIPNSVFYQNELAIARAHQEWFLPVVAVAQHNVSPTKVRLAENKIEKLGLHWSPNTLLARMLLPAPAAYAKKCACGQNLVDMARVACALERCRVAEGSYPETLDVLAPRFIAALPHDVIGGQPLKYHRTDEGRFALYSVGWNGVDDGGAVVLKKDSKTFIDYEKGDWVWTGQVLVTE